VPAERAAAREWYRDAKFGMFIHWGVYSQLGRGEG
jgi:alpha-L-fucosidase